MFGIDSSEFLVIGLVALLVIGPKDLPRVMRLVGGWVGRGRAMTRHLRAGFDTMMREAELEEMQKQWAKQNAEIMAATAVAPVAPAAFDVPLTVAPYEHPETRPGAPAVMSGLPAIPAEAAALAGPAAPEPPVEYEPSLPLEPAPAAPRP